MTDSRRFTRFSTTFGIEMQAKLSCQGQDYYGPLEDISLKGMFVSVYDKLPVGEAATVELRLAGTEGGPPLLRCQGRVARSRPGGAGLEITDISDGAFERLRELIVSLSADPARVEQELRSLEA